MTFPVSGLIRVDGESGDPLSRQIYRQMRSAILDGRIPAGVRLPSSRQLSATLGLSRTTVTAALDQLTLEGFVDARVGAGTFVAETAQALPTIPAEKVGRDDNPGPRAARLSRQGVALSTFMRRESGTGPAFSPGVPDVRLFPNDLWGRLLRAGARRPDRGQSGYDAYDGLPALKQAIVDHLAETRGVKADPGRVLVLSSAQAALDLTARMLLDEGDESAVENPVYTGALISLRGVGAKVTPVPVDGEGIVVDVLAGANPRLIYVTPSHQYPLGMTMSLERRLALLEAASQAGAYVIEDDYDSEFHYRGRPIPALAGLDGGGRVIYLGTFSKTMMPAIRTAFLILPDELVEPFRKAQRNTGKVPAFAVQSALATFLSEGHLRAHMRRVGAIYRGRRDLLVAAIECHCPQLTAEPVPDGGMQLAVRFRDPAVDDVAIARRLIARGIDCGALSAFHIGEERRSGLVLGFAMPDDEEIVAGVQVIAEEIAATPSMAKVPAVS